MHIHAAHTARRPADAAHVIEDLTFRVGDLPVHVVVDGRGGPGVGDVASRLVLDAFTAHTEALAGRLEAAEADHSPSVRIQLGRALEAALADAHERLVDAARDHADIGATVAAIAIAGNHASVAHVGDVRAYVLRDGRLRQVTQDHTKATEAVRSGSLTPTQAATSPLRRQLTQVLGQGRIDAGVSEVALADGDLLVLCTDGIHGGVAHARIERAADLPDDADLAEACERLLAQADGSDDASVVLLRIASDTDPELLADLTSVMSGSFLFRNLTDGQRQLIAPYLDHRFLETGEVLFAEGERGDTFFVVVDGTLAILRGEVELTRVGPGGNFGELTLARPAPRSATVRAVGQALVLGLSRDRFQQIVKRRPAIGASIAIAALDQVGNRVRALTDRIEQLENGG